MRAREKQRIERYDTLGSEKEEERREGHMRRVTGGREEGREE